MGDCKLSDLLLESVRGSLSYAGNAALTWDCRSDVVRTAVINELVAVGTS